MKRAHRFLDACTTGSRMLSERGLSILLTEPVLFPRLARRGERRCAAGSSAGADLLRDPPRAVEVAARGASVAA